MKGSRVRKVRVQVRVRSRSRSSVRSSILFGLSGEGQVEQCPKRNSHATEKNKKDKERRRAGRTMEMVGRDVGCVCFVFLFAIMWIQKRESVNGIVRLRRDICRKKK